MDYQTEQGLKEALLCLESGNPGRALQELRETLENDLSNQEITFTIKCCNYWINLINALSEMETPFERGERLIQEWKEFLKYIKNSEKIYEPAIYSTCKGIFSLALQNYTRLLDEKDSVQKSEILRKIGLCYKKLGEYDNAKMCLSESNSYHKDQADVLAELADCYALCGEDKAAKVLFREAFFLDFKKIDLDFLDSELIKRLIEKTAQKGFAGDSLKAWIPIYGVLWGVFTIKRALRSQEVGKLKQDIYALENEFKDPSRSSELQIPRLINMYFWLIDYCQEAHDEQLINEILLKIKILDTNIYNLYVK